MYTYKFLLGPASSYPFPKKETKKMEVPPGVSPAALLRGTANMNPPTSKQTKNPKVAKTIHKAPTQCNDVPIFSSCSPSPQCPTTSETKQMKITTRQAANQKVEEYRYEQEAQQSYRSFSTTLMTEMLKVDNHATRLMNKTPPRAFCR